MRIVAWTMTIALFFGTSASANAEVLGVSPVGRSPVYFQPSQFTAAPLDASHQQPVVLPYVPPSNLASALPQSYPQQQAYFAPVADYSQVSPYPSGAPTVGHYPPPDAYWGQALTGRIMYFRPGHPLGNLLRAFGYNGPPLTP